MKGLQDLGEGAEGVLLTHVIRNPLEEAMVAALFVCMKEVLGKASLARKTVVQTVKDVEVLFSSETSRSPPLVRHLVSPDTLSMQTYGDWNTTRDCSSK